MNFLYKILVIIFNAFLDAMNIKYIKHETPVMHIEKMIDPTEVSRGEIIMIFDTETNGLIPKLEYGRSSHVLSNMPHILQLSFILWDKKKGCVVEKYNEYIKVSPEIVISEKITEITGITREICDSRGVDIVDALCNFYRAILSCDVLVAHNIAFDKQLIDFETKRYTSELSEKAFIMKHIKSESFDLTRFCEWNEIKMACTMMETIDLCSIRMVSKFGKPYNKYPTLAELYNELFGRSVKNMHNSIIDVLVCLRCYLKYRNSIDIEDFIFDEYVADALK